MMYRFPETDAKWKESVRQRLHQLTQKFQQQIDEDPSDSSPYNQWAWLVSNTEGDFQKAIRYSHRSLELNTKGESGEASFLDTLGRCYFAAGDYENAVKNLERAIDLKPEDPTINDHLGDVLWKVGRKREATFQWKRALSFGPGDDLDMDRVRRKLDVGLDAVLSDEKAKNGG